MYSTQISKIILLVSDQRIGEVELIAVLHSSLIPNRNLESVDAFISSRLLGHRYLAYNLSMRLCSRLLGHRYLAYNLPMRLCSRLLGHRYLAYNLPIWIPDIAISCIQLIVVGKRSRSRWCGRVFCCLSRNGSGDDVFTSLSVSSGFIIGQRAPGGSRGILVQH